MLSSFSHNRQTVINLIEHGTRRSFQIHHGQLLAEKSKRVSDCVYSSLFTSEQLTAQGHSSVSASDNEDDEDSGGMRMMKIQEE